MHYSAAMNQRSLHSEKRNFIANTDCLVKKINSNRESGGSVTNVKSLVRGTLLEEHITDRHERMSALHKSRQIIAVDMDCQNANSLCAVDLNQLSPVSAEEAQLLLSVKKYKRSELLKDLDEAKLIDVGNFVRVRLPDYFGLGIVLCKGTFPEYGNGILFGIKFEQKDVNILRMKEDLFSSQQEYSSDDCDTIVQFTALSLIKSQIAETVALSFGSKLQQLSSSHATIPPPIEHLKETINENEPVSVGERVVWLQSTGAEHGVVRWVGYIPGHSELLAGVECDNPVGSGTGAHDGNVIFHVRSKHATFIPVCGLLREKDYKKPPPTNKKSSSFFKRKKKKDKDSDHKPEHTFIKSLETDSIRLKESLNPKPELKNATIQHPLQVEQLEDQPLGTSIIQNSFKSQDSGQSDQLVDINRPLSEFEKKINKYEAQGSVGLMKEESLPAVISSYQDNSDQEGLIVGKLTLRNKSFIDSQKSSDAVQINGMHVPNNDSDSGKIDYNSLSSRKSQQNKHEDQVTSMYPANSKRKMKLPPSPGVQKRSGSTPETDVDMFVLPPIKCTPRIENIDKVDRTESPLLVKSATLHSKSMGSKLSSSINQNTEMLKTSVLKRDSMPCLEHRSSSSPQMPVEDTSPDFDDLDRSIGSTHSLTRNGYTTKSGCHRSDFDEHDFLFGTDFSNKDMLESFYFNDPKRTKSHSTDTGSSFEVGSVVEVLIKGLSYFGVIRWMGYVPDFDKKVAGLEMEEEISDSNCDGTFNTEKYFSCPPGRGFYVPLNLCQRDGRFLESIMPGAQDGINDAGFGSIDCPDIAGDVAPLNYSDKLLNLFGKNKGIQGHHNSCYLDATLFSMFTFTGVFDSILHRPQMITDIQRYHEVQKVLKESIVNPLRQNLYVRADRVMKLRTLLEDLGSISGLTCEEKDPEEFLNLLLHQILKAEPFLKLSSGQETYFYQLFVEKHELLQVPTVQQLFDQSFLTSDIKLKEIPSCLIIQMPRFGKQFKTYNRIFPSLTLDITDVLEDSPRQCCSCGSIANYECRECFYQFETSFTMKAFCSTCLSVVHSHQERAGHKPRKIIIPEDLMFGFVPRVHMDLFAIVCIETSHYVAFVKCGNDPKAPWCFFDSMADRKGEQNGYNIPEVSFCPEVTEWLSEESATDVLSGNDARLSERAKRLFGDAYMCMYQSSSVMMYN